MKTNASRQKFHPFMKLGKTAPKHDSRTFQLTAILKPAAPLPLPDQWDFDLDLAKTPIPTPMFLNDNLGDCVIAGRAHATIRFEYFEQGDVVLSIKDPEVLREYQREGGSMVEGKQGLNMLDSLNWWRKKGWKAATKTYSIHAFAEIDRTKIDEVRTSIRYLNGAYIGLSLPNCWRDQINRGQKWDVVPGPDGAPNPHSGHCVYLCGYNADGPVCVTWGQKQPMTWQFFTTCCDEAYAVVDNRDRFLKKSPLDLNALDQLLAQL
jgi:hypothetical protein